MNIASIANSAILIIAGQKIPMVERITLRAKRNVVPAEGFGLDGPQALIKGATRYEVELHRMRLPVNEEFDIADFFAMDHFSVSITRDGVETAFLGCRWIEIEETLEAGERILQKVVLAAKSRGVAS